MGTRSIALERITEEEFSEMEDFLNVSHRKSFGERCSGYARIVVPHIGVDHYEVIRNLSSNPYVDEISVRVYRGPWKRIHPNSKSKQKLTNQDIAKLAELADKNPSKRHYFEVKFYSGQNQGREDRAILSFRMFDGYIIGTEMSIPINLRDIFDVKHDNWQHGRLNGLWVPNYFFDTKTVM